MNSQADGTELRRWRQMTQVSHTGLEALDADSDPQDGRRLSWRVACQPRG
jgi:hypothetical protein